MSFPLLSLQARGVQRQLTGQLTLSKRNFRTKYLVKVIIPLTRAIPKIYIWTIWLERKLDFASGPGGRLRITFVFLNV